MGAFDDFLQMFMANNNSISTSPNYQSVFYGLKNLYLRAIEDFEPIAESEEMARNFVKLALDLTKKGKGINIPQEFYDMPIHIYPGKGIVLEIPNPKLECECNYVALLCGEKKMYTNEYYAFSNVFSLCAVTESGRTSYTIQPANLEEFVKATIGELV